MVKRGAKINKSGVNSALLHAALESMSDGFTVWDDELRLVTYNKHYEDMYFDKVGGLKPGMSLKEVCDLSIANGNQVGDAAKILYKKYSSILKRTYKKGGRQLFERDVKDRIIRSSFILVDGVGQIVTHKDVTEEVREKEAEQEKGLQTSNQNIWFERAINSMSQGLCAFDDDKRLIICNRTYAKTYKLPKRLTRPGTSFKDIIEYRIKKGLIPEGETKESHLANRMALVTSKSSEQSLVEFENGRHISVLRNPMPGGGWIGIIHDITDEVRKKEAEQEKDRQTAEQNIRFDTALENMSQGLSMFGADQRLIICNQIYAEFYGLPEEMVVAGKSIEEILRFRFENGYADERETEEEFFGKRIEIVSEKLGRIEFSELINGHEIRVIKQPMRGGGWVSTHQDITEQHQKEKLIEQRSFELEQQNMRFDAAVNNMGHGLAMYDNKRRLVICNEPYKRLYDLPEDLTRPRTNFWDILDHGAKIGMVSIEDNDERFAQLNKVIEDCEPIKGPVTMLNGKTMYIQHFPMADGGWLATHEDVTEQYRSEKLIRHMARHDGLTGLLNRHAFHEAMAEKEKLIADGKIMAILCIDLDLFKWVNDSFGHAAGDAVLKTASERIAKHIGASGSAARVGGDEFAVLLGPLKEVDEAEQIAKNIIDELSKIILWEGVELNVGASMGIALSPKDGADSDTLMHNSDLALYHTKIEGRGKYCFFEKEMEERQKKRFSIEAGLKSAIARDELKLFYQPLVSFKDNRISCCEALMRWEGSGEKQYSPIEFIAVAEETGLIREMGKWALQTACASAAQWSNDTRVAVNVSPVQFISDDLVVQVAQALESSGLRADRLELEITESVSLDESPRNLEMLHKFKQMGVRIALDDFGTGYSSLSYLRSFPFDKVKIDRSFISSLSSQPESIAIIRAVVDLGKSMGMSVTAEGIETEDQLRAVYEQGCDEVQGYLFSPPLPQNSVEKLLGIRKNTQTENSKKLRTG